MISTSLHGRGGDLQDAAMRHGLSQNMAYKPTAHPWSPETAIINLRGIIAARTSLQTLQFQNTPATPEKAE